MSDADFTKKIEQTIEHTLADKPIKIVLTVKQWIAVIAVFIIPACGAIWTGSAMWRDLSTKLDRLEAGQSHLESARAEAIEEFARLKEETIRAIPDRYTATDHDTFAAIVNAQNPPVRIPYMFELRRR